MDAKHRQHAETIHPYIVSLTDVPQGSILYYLHYLTFTLQIYHTPRARALGHVLRR